MACVVNDTDETAVGYAHLDMDRPRTLEHFLSSYQGTGQPAKSTVAVSTQYLDWFY
jgi:hypothetical protein